MFIMPNCLKIVLAPHFGTDVESVADQGFGFRVAVKGDKDTGVMPMLLIVRAWRSPNTSVLKSTACRDSGSDSAER